MNTGRDNGAILPLADRGFFRVFMPYEIRLAQRRAMIWGTTPDEQLPSAFIGLYLIRPITEEDAAASREAALGEDVRTHLVGRARGALRDSDVLGVLGDDELLAVVRDLDPQQAFVVAQRLLSVAGRSEFLRSEGVSLRVGYVVYPLTSQPNFPPQQWGRLVDLARLAADGAGDPGATCGRGVLRGPAISTTDIPETDLVDLSSQDLESLVGAGLLSLQRIHLLAGL